MRYLVITLILIFVGCALGRKTYDGHKVYKVDLSTPHHIKVIKRFETNKAFDFWSKINNVQKPVVVKVEPSYQSNFEKSLHENHITYEILIDDVEAAVKEEFKIHANRPKRFKNTNPKINFDQYYRHDEINAYLADLEKAYPNLVQTKIIGKSYEGRDITLINIGTGSGEADKPTIFIDAGIHAREWIAPAVALYIIDQLVNPENSRLTEKVNWTILPSLNPDGYEYTWKEDRFWRKTRTPGLFCSGVDANRNFDFHWMESGASFFECDEDYAGPNAFSEKNAQALRDYLLDTVNHTNVAMYLTLHSYGQYLLYPWGYNSDLPPNWKELDNLGNAVNDAIKAVRGTEYTVGSSTQTLYPAAGASDDWAMGRCNIQLVYTIELPGGGSFGFDLPPSEIKGVVEETWQGILVFHDYVANSTLKN